MNPVINIPPHEFIENGKCVNFNFAFNDVNIPISCKVMKEPEKNKFIQYNLIVKGEYCHGSTAKISLNYPNMHPDDIDTKMQMAQLMLTEIIPEFITKDYPDTLKKLKMKTKP